MSRHSTGLGHGSGPPGDEPKNWPGYEPGDETLPLFATFEEWERLTGMSRRTTNEWLADGRFKAKKFGASVRLDVRHNVQVLRAQPDAVYKAPALKREAV
jgi:hypothetical protein